MQSPPHAAGDAQSTPRTTPKRKVSRQKVKVSTPSLAWDSKRSTPTGRQKRKDRRATSEVPSQASFVASEQPLSSVETSDDGEETHSRPCTKNQQILSAAAGRKSCVRVAIDSPVCSLAGIDLSSTAVNEIADINFVEPQMHHTAIFGFDCEKPLLTCLLVKRWLIKSATNGQAGMVRIESQDLHLLNPRHQTRFLLLADAAQLNGTQPITIFALMARYDDSIRWYYTLQPPHGLLDLLQREECFSTKRYISTQPHTDKHKRLFLFLCEAFRRALVPPEDPDFLAAQNITDYCPSVIDPDTAWERLHLEECHKYRKHSEASFDISSGGDRYAQHLPAAEGFLALNLDLTCATYLLIKRRFFAAFWRELVASNKKVGSWRQGSRVGKVRSDAAHLAWLQNEYGWRPRRANRLLAAWKMLGFLDERRYVEWLQKGGLLEGMRHEE